VEEGHPVSGSNLALRASFLASSYILFLDLPGTGQIKVWEGPPPSGSRHTMLLQALASPAVNSAVLKCAGGNLSVNPSNVVSPATSAESSLFGNCLKAHDSIASIPSAFVSICRLGMALHRTTSSPISASSFRGMLLRRNDSRSAPDQPRQHSFQLGGVLRSQNPGLH